MHRCHFLAAATVAAVILIADAAHAGMTSKDDLAHGPESITFDSSTQLDWLDVDRTRGLSHNQVAGQFAPGGQFAGFRHASDAEITAFFLNAGIPIVATDGFKPENYLPVRDLQELVSSQGGSGSSGIEWSTYGFAAATYEPPLGFQSSVRFLIRNESAQTAIANTLGTIGTSADDASPLIGHWIVRQVPEPSSALIMLLATAGLRVARQRNASC